MKKIMFNDKYSLTKAVLKGRKTQTRRVINLTETDKEYLDTAFDWDLRESVIVDRYAKYKVGEEVAVAQAYKDIPSISDINYVEVDWERATKNKPFGKWGCANKLPGWDSKMFVRADLMPYRIKITNVRVERLQDISDEDCFKEGIIMMYDDCNHRYVYGCITGNKTVKITPSAKVEVGYGTPSEAYAFLIDKVSGKGTWESNPWVFVYDFKLVK